MATPQEPQPQIITHNSSMATPTPQEIAVITVPFPGQGHLNQLLQISCLISSYGIPVYYVGSAIQNRQARARINGLNVIGIHFHDVPTPPFASDLPDPNSSTKFPSHLQSAWIASLNLRQPVGAFLNEMAGKFKRVVVVNDSMVAAVVQDVAAIPNAESYVINCISALSLLSYRSQNYQQVPTFETDDIPPEIIDLVLQQSEPLMHRSGDLYNTSRLIEGPYLDILEREAGDKKSWAIGPILPTKLSSLNQSESKHICLQWLDKHEPNTVLYVAFGTTVSQSNEEITELALGLEQSKVKFLWVLRDADKGNIFDGQVRRAELPEGFEERVEGVGMVVRDWVPQPQILAHPSTGGFMSHCGWNSCIESMTMGVPIAAWPMHSDQPRNTYLVTQVLKVGLVVREWEQRKELVNASKIENVVRRLIFSEEGKEIQKRVTELGTNLRQGTQPGGASRLELDSFIAHITR